MERNLTFSSRRKARSGLPVLKKKKSCDAYEKRGSEVGVAGGGCLSPTLPTAITTIGFLDSVLEKENWGDHPPLRFGKKPFLKKGPKEREARPKERSKSLQQKRSWTSRNAWEGKSLIAERGEMFGPNTRGGTVFGKKGV